MSEFGVRSTEGNSENTSGTGGGGFNVQSLVIDENLTATIIERQLNSMRENSLFNFFERQESIFSRLGLFALYVSAVLGLLASIIFPMRYEISFGYSIAWGLTWFLTCIACHYIAWKFLPGLTNLIKSNPTKLCSTAFLDSIAVSTGILGVLSLVGGVYIWARSSSTGVLVTSLAVFVISEYLFSLCLNPSSLNIIISEKASAGEEFIGLISLFMKCFVKLIPVAFGASIVLVAINLVDLLLLDGNFFLVISRIPGICAYTAMALLPAAGYLIFLQYYFLMDVALSILSLPSRLKA